jgi:hypothetical protein
MAATFPAVAIHKAVTCLPDDLDPNLYYLVTSQPALRLDGDAPVFRALFWTDQATGSPGAVAGIQGAQLNFDINLELPNRVVEEVRSLLQSSGVQAQRRAVLLREERERLERLARARGEEPGDPEPNIPALGPIRFGTLQYTAGNVVVLERTTEGFLEWSSSGGPPALIGNNNTAVALRLGPEGAAVWYRALQQDAAALGFRYSLEFEARLPSLEIHVWAGSHQSLELERKVKRTIEKMDTGCDEVDVERIDVKEISETLLAEGLVNIEIIKGSAKITDEHVGQLREAALSLISDRVKEVLQHRIRGMTEEERRTSLLGKVSEEVTAFAELRLRQRDMIKWAVNPQATMTDFLGGLDGEQRKRLVTVVDLADPVVSTLSVPVSVDAPWDTADPPVTRVNVEVTYPAAVGEQERTQSVSFDRQSSPTVLRWRRAPAGRADRGTVHYRAEAFVRGAAQPIPLRGGAAQGPVHVQVPELGKFAVQARPNLTDFGLRGSGKVTAVKLDYAYKQESDPDHVAGTAVLRPEQPDGRLITHTTFREIDAPLRVRPTYLRETGTPITGPEQFAWMRAGESYQLDLPSPWPDKLLVGARVRPGIPGLEKVGVDLTHRGSDGFASDAAMELAEDVDWQASTTLVQADASNQRFRWRYRVHGPEQLALSPWVEAEGDQELPLLPILAVRLRLDRLRLGTDYSDAVVRLAYTHPGPEAMETRQEFFVTDPAAQIVWLVPRVNPGIDRYRYSMTLFPLDPDQEPKEVPEAEGRGELLVLRPPL